MSRKIVVALAFVVVNMAISALPAEARRKSEICSEAESSLVNCCVTCWFVLCDECQGGQLKTFILLATLTALHAASRLPAPSPFSAILIEIGTEVPVALLPGVAATCSMLVFFDPDCLYCKKVAEGQAAFALEPLPTHWITADIRQGPAFMAEHLPGVDLMMSEALPAFFGVRGVPAAAWVRNRRVVATGVLSGDETAEDLQGRCDGPVQTPRPDNAI